MAVNLLPIYFSWGALKIWSSTFASTSLATSRAIFRNKSYWGHNGTAYPDSPKRYKYKHNQTKKISVHWIHLKNHSKTNIPPYVTGHTLLPDKFILGTRILPLAGFLSSSWWCSRLTKGPSLNPVRCVTWPIVSNVQQWSISTNSRPTHLHFSSASS